VIEFSVIREHEVLSSFTKQYPYDNNWFVTGTHHYLAATPAP
jgi:hypothetical protein